LLTLVKLGYTNSAAAESESLMTNPCTGVDAGNKFLSVLQ